MLDPPRSGIFGVVTTRFARTLEDRGQAFGVKFRPAGFFPFARRPVCDFTDQIVPVSSVFDDDVESLERAVLGLDDSAAQVDLVEAFLRANLPAPDPNVELIGRVVDLVLEHRDIARVEDLAARAGINARTLQRLFRRYVGVGPKWVIRRYRLHEAADRLAGGHAVDQASLAHDLGYATSALIKDFSAWSALAGQLRRGGRIAPGQHEVVVERALALEGGADETWLDTRHEVEGLVVDEALQPPVVGHDARPPAGPGRPEPGSSRPPPRRAGPVRAAAVVAQRSTGRPPGGGPRCSRTAGAVAVGRQKRFWTGAAATARAAVEAPWITRRVRGPAHEEVEVERRRVAASRKHALAVAVESSTSAERADAASSSR